MTYKFQLVLLFEAGASSTGFPSRGLGTSPFSRIALRFIRATLAFVTGHFGGGYEAGGGLNWYIRGNRDWRMTFEVLNVNRSPAQNLLTGYRAGASGTLYQLQLFTDFF